MTNNEQAGLHSYIDLASNYLEFGSGESTIYASTAPKIKTITSVESSVSYVTKNLMIHPEIRNAVLAEKLQFHFVDIGETVEWGFPRNESKRYLWPNYSHSIFSIKSNHDLVLVDGRFRVACTLNCILYTPKNCIILIHDFWNRPEYHIVLKYLKIKNRIGSLGVFIKKHDVDPQKIQYVIMKYQYLPGDKVISDYDQYYNKPYLVSGLVDEAQEAGQRDDWNSAVQLWERVTDGSGQDIQPWWQAEYSIALMELGFFDECETKLLKLIKDYPDFDGGHIGLARLADKRCNWESSVSLWGNCIKRFNKGDHHWWNTNYATALTELGRFDEAEKVYRKLRVDFPNFSVGICGLARLAHDRGKWELATDRWLTCIKEFTSEAQPWWFSNYACALLELGRLDDALGVYEKLVQDYPDFAPGHAGLAGIAQRQGNWELAAKLWETCILRFDDNIPWWLKGYAHSLIELGRSHEAMDVVRRIEGSNDDDHHTLELYAKISYLANDMEQCLKFSERLIADYPQLPQGYYWSEISLLKLNRFEEAAASYLACPGNNREPIFSKEIPNNFPLDMALPQLIGNGNDYSFIDKQLKEFRNNCGQFTQAVSIVVPIYNRGNMLSKMLTALVQQTYPGELIELIIVDDSSNNDVIKVIKKYNNYLTIRHLHQEDPGCTVASQCNLGINTAAHDYVVLLDCDVIPSRGFVEAYMGYYHVTKQAALFGLRKTISLDAYLDDDLLKNNALLDQFTDVELPNSIVDGSASYDHTQDKGISSLLGKTDRIKEEIFPSKFFVSNSVAFLKSTVKSIGLFEEGLHDWADVLLEFGYRLYNQGYYIIPVDKAIGLQQEFLLERNDHPIDEKGDAKNCAHLFQQKCPIPSARNYLPNYVYKVPKVSVYIPAYNVEEFIREAVNSVLAQTYTDFEVVVCDDGSTDKTLQVLEDNFSCDPRVRLISQSNQGIASASNRAVTSSRGMYIGQLDGDDMLEPQAIEMMVDFLDKNNVGVVYSNHNLIDRNGNCMREIVSVDFSRKRLMVDMICTAFRIFRKRDWLRTAGFDESLRNAVDYDMMLKFSEVCNIGFLPIVTYNYRYHGRNISLVNRAMQENNHLVAINNSLRRMGLYEEWKVVAGPETNQRKVKYIQMQ